MGEHQDAARSTGWDQVGEGVFRRRYEKLDQNIVAVVDNGEILLVDSRSGHGDADELRHDVEAAFPGSVGWLVNTHFHWDHTFGNARFSEATIVGHNRTREQLLDEGEATKRNLAEADWVPDSERGAFSSVVITPPTVTFTTEMAIHVGGLEVHLWHPGKGHTDSDIVLMVGDTCIAGDLVEEGAPPSFGDAFPRLWVQTLDNLLPRIGRTVVPGHGNVVDWAFVDTQRNEIAAAVAVLDGEDLSPPYSSEVMDSISRRLEQQPS